MSLNEKIPESFHFSEKKRENVIGFFGFQSIMRDADEHPTTVSVTEFC